MVPSHAREGLSGSLPAYILWPQSMLDPPARSRVRSAGEVTPQERPQAMASRNWNVNMTASSPFHGDSAGCVLHSLLEGHRGLIPVVTSLTHLFLPFCYLGPNPKETSCTHILASGSALEGKPKPRWLPGLVFVRHDLALIVSLDEIAILLEIALTLEKSAVCTPVLPQPMSQIQPFTPLCTAH